MSKIAFPLGKTIFENKAYSNTFLELTLAEIRAKKGFAGFLQLETDDQNILFFLKGKPYAAGRIENQRPLNCDVREFFEDIPKQDKLHVSLYEVDPVVLKCMLVYFQKEPTIKASTKLLNFDDIFSDIENKSADSLVILKKQEKMNFFFFLKGKPVISRYAQGYGSDTEDIPVIDQLILYAYPQDMTPVDAFIYLDISTSEAVDAQDVSETDLLEILYQENNDRRPPPLSRVVLSIVEGPDLNKQFSVALPCTIGRRGGEIILPDKIVSGRHALLREYKGKLMIEDLNSTNGTYVNGIEIKAEELHEGEIITIGKTRLRVENISLAGT